MRKPVLAALLAVSGVMLVAPIRSASADLFDFNDWYNRARSVVESLAEPSRPPANKMAGVPAPEIDRRMPVVPQSSGTLRVIPPPQTRDGDRLEHR